MKDLSLKLFIIALVLSPGISSAHLNELTSSYANPYLLTSGSEGVTAAQQVAAVEVDAGNEIANLVMDSSLKNAETLDPSFKTKERDQGVTLINGIVDTAQAAIKSPEGGSFSEKGVNLLYQGTIAKVAMQAEGERRALAIQNASESGVAAKNTKTSNDVSLKIADATIAQHKIDRMKITEGARITKAITIATSLLEEAQGDAPSSSVTAKITAAKGKITELAQKANGDITQKNQQAGAAITTTRVSSDSVSLSKIKMSALADTAAIDMEEIADKAIFEIEAEVSKAVVNSL